MSNQLNKRYVIKSLKYFKRLLEFELIHSFLTILMTKGFTIKIIEMLFKS